MNIKHTSITVRDIDVYAYHGVYEQERTLGNNFRVTVTLDFDAHTAMTYDDIEATVNYAEVVQIVHDVMLTPSNLIEHVAQRLINALLETFPIVTGGIVSVTKVKPPISIPNDGATFTVSFSR